MSNGNVDRSKCPPETGTASLEPLSSDDFAAFPFNGAITIGSMNAQ